MLFLYGDVLKDPAYILGAGTDTRVLFGEVAASRARIVAAGDALRLAESRADGDAGPDTRAVLSPGGQGPR